MNPTDTNALIASVADIRDRMKRAGDRGQVTLLAAVKYASAEQIMALRHTCGITNFGENRVQQLLEHYAQLDDPSQYRIHMIGSLQKNKVKYIVDKVCMIHSLDSLSLAEEIDRRCAAGGRIMDVLVEINAGREQSKGGLFPEAASEFCEHLAEFPHLRWRGFMTMAPKCENSTEYFKYFEETSRQCLDIWQKKSDNIYSAKKDAAECAPIFSMGMSDSFEPAIAAGATIVRIGGALFRH